MNINISQELRQCMYMNESGKEMRALLHFIYPKSWTHGSGITIGSAPAGQETDAFAVIELESGAVIHAYLCQIRMLDSEDMFNEYCWEDLEN